MAKFLHPFYSEENSNKDLDYFARQEQVDSTHGPLHAKVAKKEAAMTAIMEDADVAVEYGQIKQDLEDSGKSDTVDKWKAFSEMDLEETDVQIADIIMRDDTLDKDTKVNMLFEVQKAAEKRNPKTIGEVYNNEMMIRADTQTGQEDRVQQSFFANEEAIAKSNSDISELVRERAAQWDTSTGQAFADFAVAAVVPGFGIKLKQIIDDTLPEESPAFYNLAVGEQVAKFKETFKAADPEVRVEMAKKLLNSIDDVAASFYVNDFEQYDYLQTLLGDLNPSESSIEVDRWINNAFGVLDLVPVLGSGLRGGYKLWKTVSRSGPVGRAVTAAPKNAGQMLTEALKDERKADMLDTNAEEIVSTSVFPSPPTEPRRAAPDINDRLDVAKYLDTDPYSHGINYTPLEKTQAQERTLSRIQKINDAEGSQLLNTSDIQTIPGGYQVNMTVGHSSDYGFESIDAARDAVADFLEVQTGSKLSYLKKDYESGNWVPAKEGDTGAGEYLAQIEVKHIYNPEDAVGTSFDDAIVGASGGAAKYLDKSSVFQNWIVEAGNVAADKNAFIRTQLERRIQPLIKLGARGQARVFKILDEGDSYIDPITGKQGKWFNREELIEKFEGREPEIQAYYAVKDHQEALYELQNHRLRTRLDAAGFREVRNSESGFVNLGRPLDRGDVDTGVTRVYDADTGAMRDVTPEDIDSLYESGGRLIKLKSHEDAFGEQFDLVYSGPDSKTGLTDLPSHLLNQRPGYISRIYDTNYVVKYKRTGVKLNGKLVEPEPGVQFNGKPLKAGERLVAVKMSPTKGEALRAAKNLARSNVDEGLEYGVVEAKELRDVQYSQRQDYEYFRDKGQLYFSPRGVEIESVSGARTLKGIGESLSAARNNAAKHIAMDDFLDSMTKRWEKRYGATFGVGKERRMPLWGDIPETADPTLRAERAAAVALRDHIAIVSGVDKSAYKTYYKNLLIGMADRLSGTAESRFLLKTREELAAATLKASERGPIEYAKGLAFTRFIALNPARQLLLQSQQMTVYLGLDHGFKYFATGKGVRDFTGLAAGMSIRDNQRLWRQLAPVTAKGMGMSTKEYTEFVDAFRRSGLDAAIDSHPFANALALGRNATAAETPIMATLNRGQEGIKSVIRGLRHVGFDYGERVNIMSAWLAVRNKWIKNNPGKSWTDPDVLDQISGEARAVSFNMNPSGALAFQKGAMGLVTQFMSHATKSAQALLPQKALGKTIGKLSNKTFSGKERFRIAMMQLGLYGVGGFGLYEAWEKFRDEKGLDIPKINASIKQATGQDVDVNNILREGIAGNIVNAAFHAADVEGEESDVSFSKNFGPFSGMISGTPVATVYKAVVDGVFLNPLDSNSIRTFGAGMALPSDLMRAMEAAKFIIGGVDAGVVDNEQKAMAVIQDFGKLLPAYNNYVKAKSALVSGNFVTAFGSPTVRAASGEIMAQMLFGIRGRREESVSKTLESLRQYTEVTKAGLDTELRDTANTLYNNTLKLARQLNDGQVTHQQMVDISSREREALAQALGEEQFFRVMHHFQNRVFSDLNENNESKLANTLIKYYARGVIPLESATTNRIRNMPDFTGKQEILQWVDAMIESRPKEVQ